MSHLPVPTPDDAVPVEHRTRTILTAGGVYELRCSCGWVATAPITRSTERTAAEHRDTSPARDREVAYTACRRCGTGAVRHPDVGWFHAWSPEDRTRW